MHLPRTNRKLFVFLPYLTFPLLLFIIVAIVFLLTYKPGSWLMGWDSVMSDFNLRLALDRSIFGLWQEFQGVGHLGGHGYVSDIVRLPLLYLFSVFFPDNMIRYLEVFFLWFLGSVGVFFLAKRLSRKDFGAFIASLVYLLHPVTLQNFYVVHDAFAWLYGFLPWVIFFLINYLYQPSALGLFFLFIILFIFSFSAFIPPAVVGLFLIFMVILSFYLIFNFSKRSLLNVSAVVLVLFASQSYWLMPFTYYTFNNSGDYLNSKLNILTTPENVLKNKNYSTLANLIGGRGFYFDSLDVDKDLKPVPIMEGWQEKVSDVVFVRFQYLLFFIVIFGWLAFSWIVGKGFGTSILFLGFLFLVIMSNAEPIWEPVVGVFYKLPLFNQAFRIAYTKFSFYYVLFFSLGIASFIGFCTKLINSRRILFTFFTIMYLLLLYLIFYSSTPAFSGKFIYPRSVVYLPQEYKELMFFFEKLKTNSRVTVLPIDRYDGWGFRSWGYTGSGFLFYGIRQPILDTAFNVWSPYNETFTSELKYLVYQYDLLSNLPADGESLIVSDFDQNLLKSIEKLFDKYGVGYIILDESEVVDGVPQSFLFIPQIKDLISHSSRIKEVAKFGFLTVYQFLGVAPAFIQAPKEYMLVDADLTYSKYDPIYQKYGEYINYQDEKDKVTGYPFVNFDPRGEVKISLRTSDDGQSQLVFENKSMNAKIILPVNEKIEEVFGKDQGYKEGYNCDLKKKGTAVKNRLAKGNFYGAYGGGVSCDWFYYPQVDKSRAYVMKIAGRNISGRSLKIYLQNLRTNRMDIEELLPSGDFESYFVIYPSQLTDDKQRPGYTLNVETRSFGRIASENIVDEISFVPVDLELLYKVFKGGRGENEKYLNNLEILDFKKFGTWLYTIETKGGGILELSQGFDNGWVAFLIKKPVDKSLLHNLLDFEKLNHFKANSWSNSFEVPESDNGFIIIAFLPQILEYLGFFILTICIFGFAFTIFCKKQRLLA